MRLSIITPMYNSFSQMGRYLQSLENQLYKNFEVIVIDDCSSDNSYEELLQYKEKSQLDIKVIKNSKNTGPGPARNLGMKYMQGDYITFIDSDDYIEEECFNEIISVIKEKDLDCLIFDYFRETNNKQSASSSIPGFQEGYISNNEAIAMSTGSTWCKVYRREIIEKNHVKFPDLMRFEDMVFNKLSLVHCNKIYYLNKPLYYYVNNDNSIVNNKKNIDEKFAISAFKILENEIKNDYSNELETIFIRDLLYSSVLTMITKGMSNKDILNHIKKWQDKYPKWYKNKNIKRFSLHHRLALTLIKYEILIGLRLLSYLRDYMKR